MVVFVLLVLSPAEEYALRKVMDDLLPNETPVWRLWKATVLHEIRKVSNNITEGSGAFWFDLSVGDGFDASDRKLLATLYRDATTAYIAYQEYVLTRLSCVSP